MSQQQWVFSGCYPFQSHRLLDELSWRHSQPLFTIADNVVGIMLPYPHGFDDDEDAEYCRLTYGGHTFMHIFNLGKIRIENLVGVARCVRYETGVLPAKKRVTFALEQLH